MKKLENEYETKDKEARTADAEAKALKTTCWQTTKAVEVSWSLLTTLCPILMARTPMKSFAEQASF